MNVQQSTMTAALRRSRLIPVIVIDDPKNAVPLANALLDGGLPIAEVTLRTPVALEALRRIRHAQPEMLAGVGTVLNVTQAAQARDAGAKFVISPGFNRAVDRIRDAVRDSVTRVAELAPSGIRTSERDLKIDYATLTR